MYFHTLQLFHSRSIDAENRNSFHKSAKIYRILTLGIKKMKNSNGQRIVWKVFHLEEICKPQRRWIFISKNEYIDQPNIDKSKNKNEAEAKNERI